MPLLVDPSLLKKTVEAKKDGGWVVIDEVQKLPQLLNEVHDLISIHQKKYLFALSGSSARKLRRLNANMLAGRVLDLRFFTLTSRELGQDFALDRALTLGTLPSVYQENEHAAGILESYVGTYLREEIQQEALVENLESFGRFLKVAANLNGSILQISTTARDVGIARKTVERYFETLVDTLVGFLLPAWQPRLKVRERARSKFYFFDPGVVRALTGRVRFPLHDLEKGSLFETLILNELRASSVYLQNGASLSYYSGDKEESDIIVSLGDEHIGIEIKSGHIWRRNYGTVLKKLIAAKKITRAYGLYTGERAMLDGPINILPVGDFLERIWGGTL